MKKRTQGIILCIIIFLFFCLILSNRLIGCLWNANNNVTINEIAHDDPILTNEDYLSAEVDYYYVVDDTFDVFAINGWVQCEDTNPKEQREVYIVLSSEKKYYKIAAELYDRSDFVQGYGTEFSTLGMSKGIYNINIACYENHIFKGLKSTKYYINVSGSGVNIWEYYSDNVDIPENVEVSSSIMCDPGIIVDTERIEFWGWAVLKGQKSENNTVIMIIGDSNGNAAAYSTMKIKRTGVAEELGSSDYTMSGFWGIIQRDNVPKGDFTVRLCINDGGQWYQPQNYYYYDSVTGKINWINSQLDAADAKDDQSFFSEKVDIPVSPIVNSNIICDPGINFENGKLELWGWAVIDGMKADDQKVIIAVEENGIVTSAYSTKKIERAGVATELNNDDYRMSGFWGVLEEGILTKNFAIRLYIYNNGEWYQPLNHFHYDAISQEIVWVNSLTESAVQ